MFWIIIYEGMEVEKYMFLFLLRVVIVIKMCKGKDDGKDVGKERILVEVVGKFVEILGEEYGL